jgi:hypothetical protein
MPFVSGNVVLVGFAFVDERLATTKGWRLRWLLIGGPRQEGCGTQQLCDYVGCDRHYGRIVGCSGILGQVASGTGYPNL